MKPRRDFQLHYKAEINKKPVEVATNFHKSDSSDIYFFNNYHASLEKGKDEKAEQTFYLNKGKGVTGVPVLNRKRQMNFLQESSKNIFPSQGWLKYLS